MSTRRSKRSSGASDTPNPPPPALDTPDARLERLRNKLEADKDRILAAAAAEMEKEEQERVDEVKRRNAADKEKKRLAAEKQRVAGDLRRAEEARLADAERVQQDASRLVEKARAWAAGGGSSSNKGESHAIEALKEEEEEEEEERVVVSASRGGDYRISQSRSRGVSRFRFMQPVVLPSSERRRTSERIHLLSRRTTPTPSFPQRTRCILPVWSA